MLIVINCMGGSTEIKSQSKKKNKKSNLSKTCTLIKTLILRFHKIRQLLSSLFFFFSLLLLFSVIEVANAGQSCYTWSP
jgi:hypothetical protein